MADYTIVVRKPCFDLPTACPSTCTSDLPTSLFNWITISATQIQYVAYDNEKGGVIERLKEDGIVDLDAEFQSVPEWISMKAMVSSWLADALKYELWVETDGTSAQMIYCSDLPWPIGKVLFLKEVHAVKQQLGITKDNAEEIEAQIYRRASIAFGALSSRLVDHTFLYEDRPSSLDAVFLSQALIILHALPETSVLRSKLLEHENLVKYAESKQTEFVVVGTSSSVPNFHANPSSSAPKRGSKPKTKPKREKMEEKDFKRRAKYFLVAQLVSVVLFLTLLSTVGEIDVEEDDEGFVCND